MLGVDGGPDSRVGVVGCGYWGRNLVRNFAALGVLGGVSDPRPAARAELEAFAPGVPCHPDMSVLLDDPSVVAVVVATPAATHVEICTRALRAGKDVFCEKPLALTYDEGRRVAALAKEEGRILMVGHVLEYHPAIRRVLDLVAEGELGTLRYVYSRRLNLGRIRREENILSARVQAPRVATILREAAA